MVVLEVLYGLDNTCKSSYSDTILIQTIVFDEIMKIINPVFDAIIDDHNDESPDFDLFKIYVAGEHKIDDLECVRDDDDMVNSEICCLQFDDEDGCVITGCTNNTADVWESYDDDFARGRKRMLRVDSLRGHTSAICGVVFDKQKIITTSADYSVMIWDRYSNLPLHTLRGHSGAVLCCAFEGPVLVSGSADNTIKVWHFGRPVRNKYNNTDDVDNDDNNYITKKRKLDMLSE